MNWQFLQGEFDVKFRATLSVLKERVEMFRSLDIDMCKFSGVVN